MLDPGARLGLLASGLFLVAAILTGGWKYAHIHRAVSRRAPTYVNIAHQAALAYSFASLVLAALAQLSAWPHWVNATATALALAQFGFATTAYIIHGFDREMKSQFVPPHKLGPLHLRPSVVHGLMIMLFASELAAAAVLVSGFVVAQA
jgi:hypothetical protein